MESGPDCFDHTSVTVTIEDPDIYVNPPPATCAPNTIDLSSLLINELNAVGPPSGLFYFLDSLDGVNMVNQLPSPVVTTGGTYWIRYQRPTGCFDVGPVDIVIYEQADITIDYPPVICASDCIDLDTLSYTDANNTTIVTKEFYTSQALAATGLSALAMNNTVVCDGGPYFLRLVTDNGCVTIVEINISVLSAPEISLSGNTSVCTGETVDLTFNLTGLAPFTIVYSDGGSNITVPNINSTTHVETVTINATTTFTLVSVDDATICTGILNGGPLTVTANPLPTATISGDATICDGDATTLTFNFTGNGPFDVVYSDGGPPIPGTGWSDGHTESVSPGSTTNYSLISVEDALGCVGTVSGSATVTVTQPLQVINVLESCNNAYSGYTVSF